MKKIEALIKPFKLDDVREALAEIGITGVVGGMLFANIHEAFLIISLHGQKTKIQIKPWKSKIYSEK